jgi:hypothetical protein
MEVGDMVKIYNAPFEGGSLFVYKNGDLGIIRGWLKSSCKPHTTCIVILLKDFKEYHIPYGYMKKMGPLC